jgi:subtilisin family serine protease
MTSRKLKLFSLSISLVLIFSPQIGSRANQPEISFLQIDQIHKSGITGKGYSVAIIDDGLDTTHPYFTGADILGVNINIDGSATVGRDAARKIGFHGPGAAGVVVGQKNASTSSVTVYGDPVYGGWAPGARLIFITFDQYGEQRLGEERALDWVTNNYKKYNIVAVSLANYSYNSNDWLPPCGGRPYPAVWEQSVNNLLNTPVALVVAAGNESRWTEGSIYPGCMDKAISVSAYQDPEINRVVAWSNLDPSTMSIIGPCCYVSAASNIPESRSSDLWANYGGTSSTTPIIASLIALANQARPGITREEVIAAMRETASRYTLRGYVFPIINIAAFFNRLNNPAPIDISVTLKGAFNFVDKRSNISATPSPAPTVTVTATPSPAPTVTVTATPSPAPTVTVTATPKSRLTISLTCVKGKSVKKVVGSNPKCPVGYKKK